MGNCVKPISFKRHRFPADVIRQKMWLRRAVRELGLKGAVRPGGMQANNLSENSHLPIRRRERTAKKFKSQGSAQRFLTSHGSICNTFNLQETPIRRSTIWTFRAAAHDAWAAATVVA